MPQTRIGNFGETAVSWLENAERKFILPKGVYEGFSLGVTTAFDLEIAPGEGVQHNGVVWFEGLERIDGDVQLDSTATVTVLFTPPGGATDYTIVAKHENQSILGGVGVSYELQGGILPDATDGVVLGWIRHPGGAIPLATTMLQDAPKQRADLYAVLFAETLPVEDIPSYTRAIDDPNNGTTGPDVTVSPLLWEVATFTLYQDVTSSPTAVGVQTVIQHFQYYVPDVGHRPQSFDVWLDLTVAPSTQLTMEVFDTAQSPVTVTGSPILTTTGWEEKTIDVDMTSGTFTAGEPFTLRLTYQLAVGGNIKTGRVRARYWPFP